MIKADEIKDGSEALANFLHSMQALFTDEEIKRIVTTESVEQFLKLIKNKQKVSNYETTNI